jgi:hypothetical protein
MKSGLHQLISVYKASSDRLSAPSNTFLPVGRDTRLTAFRVSSFVWHDSASALGRVDKLLAVPGGCPISAQENPVAKRPQSTPHGTGNGCVRALPLQPVLTPVAVQRNNDRFSARRWSSTLAPNQTFLGQSRAQGTILATFWGRLVNKSQSSHGVLAFRSSIPLYRLTPMFIPEESPTLTCSPDPFTHPFGPSFRIAVLAPWRNPAASPPGIKGMVGPFD